MNLGGLNKNTFNYIPTLNFTSPISYAYKTYEYIQKNKNKYHIIFSDQNHIDGPLLKESSNVFLGKIVNI